MPSKKKPQIHYEDFAHEINRQIRMRSAEVVNARSASLFSRISKTNGRSEKTWPLRLKDDVLPTLEDVPVYRCSGCRNRVVTKPCMICLARGQQ
jgi:hypothetical protein